MGREEEEEEEGGKKEATQQNIIGTICGLILSFFCLQISFPECFKFTRDPGGKVEEKGPLNVQECTFAKHHTKQGPE